MTNQQHVSARRRSSFLIAAAMITGALVAALGLQSWVSTASTTRPRPASLTLDQSLTDGREQVRPSRADAGADHRGPLGVEGGSVPAGATVFDDAIPAVANLDPDLLAALRRAASAARTDGVEFVVNSGWRSPAYQDHLLQEAIAKYGSAEEAARWVATADTSPHVAGKAIDLGPVDATPWLAEHGAAYGLCQIYRNEPWHYELRPEAVEQGCPAMYADPSQDPRMQK
ncbi:M15 family metallopeptidase [Microlunatus soli]|uniref:D-alanyl-D-alanine carboxypeptidase n=1 Tax=Microlunatus soli TaxID=630515 RepID=A0A1H1UC96_9ACTN|nr:M15 family metallopeptidase [Microlunatus soli]SDS69539.1 D-alanyl-D-alanine carboxypeptidase [Microlunatus soli]